MKKLAIIVPALLLAAVAAFGQFGGPTNYGKGGSIAPPPPKKAPTTRTLTGQVLSSKDDALANAVVNLKDLRSNTIRSYITAKDGAYHFSGLAPNQDYEVYAQLGNTRSSTRTLSSFDSRTDPTLNLRIEVQSK